MRLCVSATALAVLACTPADGAITFTRARSPRVDAPVRAALSVEPHTGTHRRADVQTLAPGNTAHADANCRIKARRRVYTRAAAATSAAKSFASRSMPSPTLMR